MVVALNTSSPALCILCYDVYLLSPSSNHIFYVNRKNLRLFKMLKIKEFGEFLEKRFMQYKDFVDEYAIHLWHSMPYVGADVDH